MVIDILNIYLEYTTVIMDNIIAMVDSFFRYATTMGILQNNNILVLFSTLPYFRDKYSDENKAKFKSMLLYFSHFSSL